MDPKLYNFIGLLFAMAGAIILAFGLIVSPERARQVGLPLMVAESDEYNLCLPHVRDRTRTSRFALLGIVVMSVGFMLQIIGHWPWADQPSVELLTPTARLCCRNCP